MKNFTDRLIDQIQTKKSPVCVGLDPRVDRIPSFIIEKVLKKNKDELKASAEAVYEFNKGIINAVYDLAPAVKPQIAFYELLAEEGIRVLRKTIEYAKSKGLIVILDAKRNDIGTTAEAYARAYLGEVFDADAITITPYLGWDGIKPFVKACRQYNKGIFILVKTSNASSGDLQDLCIKEGQSVYEIMGQYIESWGADDIGEHGYSSVGAVIGATYPEQAEELRAIMPKSYFLVPGYGAQGAQARDVKACFNEDGLGAIINSSRGIIFAYESSDKYTEKEYDKAAREAVKEMIKDLNFN